MTDKIVSPEYVQKYAAAKEDALKAKRDRDEALDALQGLYEIHNPITDNHKERDEKAYEVLRKHGRLPAAGGAE